MLLHRFSCRSLLKQNLVCTCSVSLHEYNSILVSDSWFRTIVEISLCAPFPYHMMPGLAKVQGAAAGTKNEQTGLSPADDAGIYYLCMSCVFLA